MIKWPITYTDYNGEEQTETFYFNLNKAEVMELNLNANGAYGDYLQQIINARDGAKIAQEYKRLILMSYGEKSPDGRRFIKSKELSDAFEQSEAFSELYMEIAIKDGAAEKFINGIMPDMGGIPVPEEKRLVK